MALFNRMHIYSVHVNPASKRPLEEAVFVREGFSKGAFFFHLFWALYHRLWLAAALFFVMVTAAGMTADYLTRSGDSRLAITLGMMTVIGFIAADLRQYTLHRRGWIITDLVIAESELEATQRFYDRHVGRNAAPLFENAPPPIT